MVLLFLTCVADLEGEDGNLWFEKVGIQLSNSLQGSAKRVWNSRTWFGLARDVR